MLYDPCGRLLRRLWPPKTKARPTSLHTETFVEPSQQLAEAGDLSSAEDLRRRACDALEELDKQLAGALTPAVKGGMGVLRGRALAAKVANKAAKHAGADPPPDSRMEDAKLALRFQVDRLLSEEGLQRLAGTQLRDVLAALRQYLPPPPTSGSHGKLGGEKDSDPCEALLKLEEQLRAVLSARTEALAARSGREVLAVPSATASAADTPN